MPSSTKTPALNLNKWLGMDKPKKDDFNSDNQKLDDAAIEMDSRVSALDTLLTGHTGNIGAHVTPEEKASWGSGFTIGTYQGDNAASRRIELGFAPRFGILFAAGASVVRVHMDTVNCNINSGYFSQQGCCEGISTDASGLTVSHHANARPNGHTLKLNDSGVTYVYIVWK
ncbi:MAG: hypothetical protein FWH02_05510 [Oscillospiraceae bacterium]|nr:hypothetical protein [Oscillospiraceae bacterium]